MLVRGSRVGSGVRCGVCSSAGIGTDTAVSDGSSLVPRAALCLATDSLTSAPSYLARASADGAVDDFVEATTERAKRIDEPALTMNRKHLGTHALPRFAATQAC